MNKLSEIYNQEEYINTLRQIKEVEEKAHQEIEKRKSQTDEAIKDLEKNLKDSIHNATENGKKLVEQSVSDAKAKADSESKLILDEAITKSKTFTFKADPKVIKEIVQILLSKV